MFWLACGDSNDYGRCLLLRTEVSDSNLAARGFSLSERRNRREKPLVRAFDNLTSMPRLIDIEKTSKSMRDITYQPASLVPRVHLSYLL